MFAECETIAKKNKNKQSSLFILYINVGAIDQERSYAWLLFLLSDPYLLHV
jgi:hypothetical protein